MLLPLVLVVAGGIGGGSITPRSKASLPMDSSRSRHTWNPKMGTTPSLLEGEVYRAELPEVVDGDGVRLIVHVGDSEALVEVRLFGIDAPEHNQQLGPEAAATLQRLLGEQTEWRLLVTTNRKSYGRTIGLLYHPDSSPDSSINRRMVELGMAYWDLIYTRPSEYGIAEAETEARFGRRGLWKDSPSGEGRPWDHRKAQEDDDFIAAQERKELHKARGELRSTREELSRLREQLRSRSLDREHLRRENDQLSDDLVMKELRLSELSRRSEQVDDRLESMDRELRNAHDQVGQLRQERSRLQTALLDAETPWLVKMRRAVFGR